MSAHIDDYLRHEALDRTSMLADMVERHLVEHPFIQSRPDLVAYVTSASEILQRVYQIIGQEHIT
jgi:cell fate (sporulation/competence/biofilm development) regulator YmcA (YheA/YmcA/DUF963 family)